LYFKSRSIPITYETDMLKKSLQQTFKCIYILQFVGSFVWIPITFLLFDARKYVQLTVRFPVHPSLQNFKASSGVLTNPLAQQSFTAVGLINMLQKCMWLTNHQAYWTKNYFWQNDLRFNSMFTSCFTRHFKYNCRLCTLDKKVDDRSEIR
jgi:hypothetical protein